MDETKLAEELKKNIPTPDEFTPAPKQTPPPPGQATADASYELDELTQYKLHEFFGEEFRQSNSETKEWLKYIYEQVGSMIGTMDYLEVMGKIRDLQMIAGLQFGERRVYKFYQWLRLDEMRRNTETEMSLLGGSSG